MNDRSFPRILAAAIFSLAVSASCVDDKYRIDDIDTSVQIAPGGIEIPLSSIEKKTLGEMFGNIEQLVADSETGYYSFRYSMSYGYSVPGIGIDNTLSLGGVLDKIFVRGSDVEEDGGTHDIGGSTAYSSQFRVSETVRAIKNIVISSARNIGTNVTMRILLHIENPLLETLYIDDFMIQLPQYLVVADDPRVDSRNVYRDPLITVESGGRTSFEVILAELRVTDLQNISIGEDQIATLQGRFDFSGTVRTPEGSEIDPDAPQMEITPEIDISDVQLTALEGELGLKLDDYISERIRPIELKAIFDAIGTGGQKCPDLAAPVVMVSIVNPVGIGLSGSMVFDPKNSAGESLGKITADGLQIKGSADGKPCENLIYITDNASECAPQGYVPYNVNTSELVETLPYTIDLDISASALPNINHLIDLGADSYEFGLKLDVDIPLAFGEDMDLTIERSVPVGRMFSKLAGQGVRVSEIGVAVELEVSFPLIFENIGAGFVDSDDNSIPGLTTSVSGIIQGPAPGEGGARTSRLEIALSVPGGGDLQALEAIEKLNLSIPISGTGTVNRLNRDDYVAGKLWLILPQGISVDLEKLGQD